MNLILLYIIIEYFDDLLELELINTGWTHVTNSSKINVFKKYVFYIILKQKIKDIKLGSKL